MRKPLNVCPYCICLWVISLVLSILLSVSIASERVETTSKDTTIELDTQQLSSKLSITGFNPYRTKEGDIQVDTQVYIMLSLEQLRKQEVELNAKVDNYLEKGLDVAVVVVGDPFNFYGESRQYIYAYLKQLHGKGVQTVAVETFVDAVSRECLMTNEEIMKYRNVTGVVQCYEGETGGYQWEIIPAML